jgi:hypothetical protein
MSVKVRHSRSWKGSHELHLPVRVVWAASTVELTLSGKGAMHIADGNGQDLKP